MKECHELRSCQACLSVDDCVWCDGIKSYVGFIFVSLLLLPWNFHRIRALYQLFFGGGDYRQFRFFVHLQTPDLFQVEVMYKSTILSQMQARSIKPHSTVEQKLHRPRDFNENRELGNVFDGYENSGYFSHSCRLFIHLFDCIFQREKFHFDAYNQL